jgi:3-phenylpropionate/cinnamic acid dioxygenase small subunit
VADILRDAEQFVYHEARLADEQLYAEWEALWTDDGVYWVPANADDIDPQRQMSIIFDNRARIATRVKQLMSGKRHSQTPPSRLRRLISNFELIEPETGQDADIGVGANFIVCESRERGLTLWGGRNRYTLRMTGDGLKMARKTVLLVDNDRPLSTLAFLI